MLENGTVLEDRYRIERQIGQGGKSTVYLAVQIRTGRLLAVKEIRNSSFSENVREHIQLLKDLDHPGLPGIVDTAETSDSVLLIMDYVPGQNLKTLLETGMRTSGKPFSTDEVFRIGIALCGILEYLHSMPQPLIYRDLKPGNIIMRPDSRIMLVDFGTIRAYKEGKRGDTVCLGTPGYAAPEQYRADIQSGPAADIYALGAVLHQLITGADPTVNPFRFQKITKVNPDLCREYRGTERKRILGLERILEKCTQVQPEKRYPDISGMKQDLCFPEQTLRKTDLTGMRRGAAPVISAGMALVCAVTACSSEKSFNLMQEKGTEMCLEKAEKASDEDAVRWIRSGLHISPGSSACFDALLNRALSDGTFSDEEQILVTELLNEVEDEEFQDNGTLMRADTEAWFQFSCCMGEAVYYESEGIPNYIAAESWFNEAVSISLEQMEDAVDEETFCSFTVRQERAEILKRISGYRGSFGKNTSANGQTVSADGYWEDLMGLMDLDGSEVGTGVQLGLYSEILELLYNWSDELKQAGVDRSQMLSTAKQIREKAGILAEDGNNLTDMQKKAEKVGRTADAVIEKMNSITEPSSDENKEGAKK